MSIEIMGLMSFVAFLLAAFFAGAETAILISDPSQDVVGTTGSRRDDRIEQSGNILGVIDEVCIHNRALSSEEVQALMKLTR